MAWGMRGALGTLAVLSALAAVAFTMHGGHGGWLWSADMATEIARLEQRHVQLEEAIAAMRAEQEEIANELEVKRRELRASNVATATRAGEVRMAPRADTAETKRQAWKELHNEVMGGEEGVQMITALEVGAPVVSLEYLHFRRTQLRQNGRSIVALDASGVLHVYRHDGYLLASHDTRLGDDAQFLATGNAVDTFVAVGTRSGSVHVFQLSVNKDRTRGSLRHKLEIDTAHSKDFAMNANVPSAFAGEQPEMTGLFTFVWSGKHFFVTTNTAGAVRIFTREGATKKVLRTGVRATLATRRMNFIAISDGKRIQLADLRETTVLDYDCSLPEGETAVRIVFHMHSSNLFVSTESGLLLALRSQHHDNGQGECLVEGSLQLDSPVALSPGRTYLMALAPSQAWVFNTTGDSAFYPELLSHVDYKDVLSADAQSRLPHVMHTRMREVGAAWADGSVALMYVRLPVYLDPPLDTTTKVFMVVLTVVGVFGFQWWRYNRNRRKREEERVQETQRRERERERIREKAEERERERTREFGGMGMPNMGMGGKGGPAMGWGGGGGTRARGTHHADDGRGMAWVE